MDREGFRNRLKQYKLAREENPGLKYWEWKNIPKYNEGIDGVPPQKYRIVGKDPEFREAAQSAIDWTTNWHDARKATGKYDEQYESISPFIKRPTPIVSSPLGGDRSGKFAGTFESATVRIDPNVSPWWGDTTESAIVHELAHETSAENLAEGMPASQAKGSAIIDKVSEITGSPKFHTNEQGSQYENNAVEEYARLQLMRHAMKADPTKKYSLSELKSWLKKFFLPDDERGVRLMNEVAQADINSKSRLYTAAEGGIIPKYDEGTGGVGNKKEIPTQEEYITQQINAKIAAAHSKSLTRTEPRVPVGQKIGERWNPWTKRVESIFEPAGPSCAYTFSDNYGQNWMGSEDFRQNHADYGWRLIPWESRQPGDAVLIVDDKGTARHTMLYDSDDPSGQPLFNHSNGGRDYNAIRKKSKFPSVNPYLTYRYVGTPADSTQWINDYKKIYGFAEGTDGVLESYYNPTTVEGVLAKTALQLADPTGVSSYPDVWYSGKEFLKSPSWDKLGDVGLNTLSALPLIGKVTAPFKAAKMAKLLARIEDANALVKGVEKANRLNRAIDTVPELLPVVRRGAEKVQDVTSSLITNPMFNYISNQNKFDLVRNYRNVNAAVDAVNISNNTADLTQGMGALIGYGK